MGTFIILSGGPKQRRPRRVDGLPAGGNAQPQKPPVRGYRQTKSYGLVALDFASGLVTAMVIGATRNGMKFGPNAGGKTKMKRTSAEKNRKGPDEMMNGAMNTKWCLERGRGRRN